MVVGQRFFLANLAIVWFQQSTQNGVLTFSFSRGPQEQKLEIGLSCCCCCAAKLSPLIENFRVFSTVFPPVLRQCQQHTEKAIPTSHLITISHITHLASGIRGSLSRCVCEKNAHGCQNVGMYGGDIDWFVFNDQCILFCPNTTSPSWI
jgi:hypothetical protein